MITAADMLKARGASLLMYVMNQTDAMKLEPNGVPWPTEGPHALARMLWLYLTVLIRARDHKRAKRILDAFEDPESAVKYCTWYVMREAFGALVTSGSTDRSKAIEAWRVVTQQTPETRKHAKVSYRGLLDPKHID